MKRTSINFCVLAAVLIVGSYLWPSKTLRQTSPSASHGVHGWAVDVWTENRTAGMKVRAQFQVA